MRYVAADEAVRSVKSGDHIHLSSIASVPHVLIEALCKRADAGEVEDLHFHHFHTEGPAPYSAPEYAGKIFDQGFFVGPNVRANVNAGWADYLPAHLFESQFMYRSGALPCDVAMVQVLLPDENGMVSLGTSVDFVRGAKLSMGGKAIIAMASRTAKGASKIVPVLKPGAGVVTPRADVQWVVTEYGAVNLYGNPCRRGQSY